MSDDLRAAEALAALQGLSIERWEEKAAVDTAVLDIESRDVTTLFSVDSLDVQGDITPVSAFTRSIKQRPERIPHLYMHDLHSPSIARIVSFAPVDRAGLPADVQQEHPDATGGMTCVSRFLKTARADEVFQGIKEGIPYGASFGYTVLASHKQQLPSGKTARVLDEVKLYEVSTVPSGHAAQPASRTRLGKALAILEEIKTGRRHSTADITFLNQIAELVLTLGATNIRLLLDEPGPQIDTAPTSSPDALMAELATIFEVTV
jgi:HK97 family phage prohead protease